MRICELSIAIGLVLWLPLAINCQEDELELIDTIEKLQAQMDSEIESERELAEAKLIKLGPGILDFIDPIPQDATTDFRQRLTRVRTTLEKAAVNAVTKPSKLNLSGSMLISAVLKQIRQQTGNEIEVADPSLLDISIDLRMVDVEFWTAMDEIMSKSKLRIDRYGSSKPGQIMLVPSQANLDTTIIPSTSSQIFQIQVLRVDSSANLLQPNLDFTTVNLLVRWEPRLRPISIEVPMSKVQVVDEFGDSVMLANQREVVYGMVQQEIPEVEFSLQLPRLDRQIESIESIQATIDAVLPGRTELFRFKKLSKLKIGFQLKKAGAIVTFGGTRKNEDVYAVKLGLSFDKENNALESHQGWVFQNEVYLQDNKGNREDAISIETLRQDNQRVTVQYYFLEEPGDRTLVYKTPATIVKLPVTIELNKIPLP